ncbi:magnesium transporter MgtE N-terminal domain-containing protein [Clostridium grantii]|uniref:PRC-barrel domain-containing protein n=1 Tax=Clostridium grantii DSM 8605 TaxID=1121316 RepID=A0A1M5RS04_9CLOT|nr:CBS domain-containing protein [Clostridium grantii]SHH29054.1 PRC-barrel domain-containing protein [Clostridium grantii DSM 8605]
MNKINSFYLSKLLHRDIYDEYGDCIGRVWDIYATDRSGYPKAIGYQVKKDGEIFNYEFRHAEFFEDKGKLTVRIRGAKDIIPRRFSFLLSRNLLDKQIVDVNGKKVVRVNDLRLADFNGELRAIAVETGILALSRRYKLNIFLETFYRIIRKKITDTVVMWDDVESLEVYGDNLKISIPYKKISKLHPADIADIIEGVDLKYRNKIFESLDETTAADTLEEIEPEFQARIIESLSDSKIKDVVVNMSNDEIADLMEEVDKNTQEKILLSLESEDEEIVRGLMKYEDETVGSIMNTDHISFSLNIKIGEVVEILRESRPEEKALHYIYIIDEEEKIQGVISIRELLLSDPEKWIKEVMDKDVITAVDHEKIDNALKKCIKYDLTAIPVVNDDKKLQGIVIINDIIDEFYFEKGKKILKKAI